MMTNSKAIQYPCDFKATTKGVLKTPSEAIHERVKCTSDQCDPKATSRVNLQSHVMSMKVLDIHVINVNIK